MSIPGTATDTVELISQLKTLRFGKISDEDVVLKMNIKKNGEYYAKDIKVIEGVDLRTPDVLLLRSLGDREITLELILRKHRGFIEARKHADIPEGFVQVDGMFSPIERVSYEVKEAMVEQEFSHEQVKFTITTDGTIDAKDAIQLGAKIVRKHFEIFEDMSERMTDTEIFQEKERERESIDNTSIEELELSVRSTNALKLAGVKTVGELRRVNETELKDFKNMGITSVIEVKDKLKKLGVGLGEY
jgi:DNA-directed RNA polymerase subunit alpha